MKKTTIKPAFVTISGLKSDVDRIEEVRTEAFDVEGLQKTKSFEVGLVMDEYPEMTLSTEKVKVSLLLGEKKENKRFTAVPIEVVGSDFISSVKPRYVSIEIQGAPGVLSFAKRSDLEAFVEARDLVPGKRYTKEIRVKIPPNTSLIETFPENATVELYNQKRLK